MKFIVLLLLFICAASPVAALEGNEYSEKLYKDIMTLNSAVKFFKLAHGNYPESLQDLTEEIAGKIIIGDLPLDPWGNNYKFKAPSSSNENGFDIYSLGKDNKVGGLDENADCGNWNTFSCKKNNSGNVV